MEEKSKGQIMITELRNRLKQAMFAKEEAVKNVLQFILGEISTLEARSNKAPTEDQICSIIQRTIENNKKVIQKLELEGITYDCSKLLDENKFLGTLLPTTLSVEDIRKELSVIVENLKSAKNDGQATGMSIEHLKKLGLKVNSVDVISVVKELRK